MAVMRIPPDRCLPRKFGRQLLLCGAGPGSARRRRVRNMSAISATRRVLLPHAAASASASASGGDSGLVEQLRASRCCLIRVAGRGGPRSTSSWSPPRGNVASSRWCGLDAIGEAASISSARPRPLRTPPHSELPRRRRRRRAVDQHCVDPCRFPCGPGRGRRSAWDRGTPIAWPLFCTKNTTGACQTARSSARRGVAFACWRLHRVMTRATVSSP